jgi:hypothetical protein
LVSLDSNKPDIGAVANQVERDLEAAGVEVLHDDRDGLSPGLLSYPIKAKRPNGLPSRDPRIAVLRMHAGNFDPPESEDGDAHVQVRNRRRAPGDNRARAD